MSSVWSQHIAQPALSLRRRPPHPGEAPLQPQLLPEKHSLVTLPTTPPSLPCLPEHLFTSKLPSGKNLLPQSELCMLVCLIVLLLRHIIHKPCVALKIPSAVTYIRELGKTDGAPQRCLCLEQYMLISWHRHLELLCFPAKFPQLESSKGE